ncbi:MAG TPA: alpha/beta hydrolase [Chloroflexota bacterium]|nr:alpha/beta hydrolase [Chloroflexota bacterium]
MSITGNSRVVPANGLRLHYLEWGDTGTPTVLLHGFGNEAHIWDLFAPAIVPRCHVFAPDARGHGDSQWAPEYGAEHNAADLAALLDALGLPAINLVGFSMGGMCSLLYASDHPERVERLVLVDVGPAASPGGTQNIRQVVQRARDVFPSAGEALAYIRLANPRRSEELVQASLRHAFRRQDDGTYRLKSDPALRQGAASQPRPSEEQLWERLGRIACPCLIVRGAESPQLSQATAERMLEVLPNARLEVVSGAGHTVMMDNPAGFEAVVSSFL